MWEGSIRGSNPLLFNFIYHFWQKRCSFCISSTEQWYPFYRPSLERFIPLNCCKFSVFKLSKNHKTKKFSLDFARKSSISLCRVFYQRKNRFPYPFIYLRLEKGTPFEMYWRSLPLILSHYREYPLPRCQKAWIWMAQVFRVSLAIQASYSGQKHSVRLPIEYLIFKGINVVRDDEFLETILSFVTLVGIDRSNTLMTR